MQVALAQLSQHLQRGLSALYVLHGDEPLLQQEAADAIRATARAQGYTERSSYTVAFMDQGELLETRPAAEFFGSPGHERSRTFLNHML